MKQFIRCSLLLCFVLPVVLETAMGQLLNRRTTNSAPRSNATSPQRPSSIAYNGVKLGIDSPLEILRELADGGWSDNNVPDDFAVMKNTWAAGKFYLAQCYLIGHNGCNKNDERAAELFQASFDEAYLRWHILDTMGRDLRIILPAERQLPLPLNVAEALAAQVERQREATAKGDANAFYTLGIYHALAVGGTKNLLEAEKNFRQAAEKGHVGAMYNLGVYHSSLAIPGTSRDMREAERWFRQAAERGHEEAKHMLEMLPDERRERQGGRSQPNLPRQSGNNQQFFQLTPGDVILEINGERIRGQEDVTSAIARSPQTMYLTVRDGRTGATARFATTLNSNRPRFGVTHQTNSGGGSRVTGVNRNSPATRLLAE